ncbi:hypothetical protein VTK73DRAFT_6135 [Phialemonium thermophilum]|uniref:F-box domain-containing protein n=1 Tax=Phialemonium thermophilum TaxID=223376 RepID=A0ABR3WKZ0_9PEZI
MIRMAMRTNIYSLPNELLISALSPLRTRELLPLATVSHRFHDIVFRILQGRLSRTAALPGHRLILECYHPSVAISTPWMYCDHIETDRLPSPHSSHDATSPAKGSSSSQANGTARHEPSFADLGRLYSHFRPVPQQEIRRARGRTRLRVEQLVGAAPLDDDDDAVDTPSHDVHLDEDELFTQLCTIINVVRLGPGRGYFTGQSNVSDGVIRVWRNWLADAAAASAKDPGGDVSSSHRILWSDATQDVGVRFRVTEIDQPTTFVQRPVLVTADEQETVSYRLEFQELLVRTKLLLMALEKSEDHQSTSGNALVLFSG